MREVFADTFYFLALAYARDSAHHDAVEYSKRNDLSTVTTTWVLAEVGNALTHPRQRSAFLKIVALLRANPLCTIIPPSQAQFEDGLNLFEKRDDKEWSLTDCISFTVMSQRGLTEALTGDHHFEQAGYKALLITQE